MTSFLLLMTSWLWTLLHRNYQSHTYMCIILYILSWSLIHSETPLYIRTPPHLSVYNATIVLNNLWNERTPYYSERPNGVLVREILLCSVMYSTYSIYRYLCRVFRYCIFKLPDASKKTWIVCRHNPIEQYKLMIHVCNGHPLNKAHCMTVTSILIYVITFLLISVFVKVNDAVSCNRHPYLLLMVSLSQLYSLLLSLCPSLNQLHCYQLSLHHTLK